MANSVTTHTEKQPARHAPQPPGHAPDPPPLAPPPPHAQHKRDAYEPNDAHQKHFTPWQRWVQRPQRLWLRRALFQVHLWVGIGLGLYVLVISISGSLVVYRPQLSKKFSRPAIILTPSATRMTPEQLQQKALHLYPGYQVDYVSESRKPEGPFTIVLEHDHNRIARLFNPYTGADLGSPISRVQRIIEWFVDLHDNLLLGTTGRLLNGFAAILVTLLAFTGVVLWWPGIKNWRRSLVINWKTNPARVNWDLHSAVGIWCVLFVLLWGVSGIYFAFPQTITRVLGDRVVSSLVRYHFGRMGWASRPIWTILGLAPAVLFVTGALMWWNRVLRKHLPPRARPRLSR
jgi:uncharacterized iron-regulated membrane protein